MKKTTSIISIATAASLLFINSGFSEVKVQTIDVKSDNVITGDVTAKNGSTVTVGDTTISNSTANEITSSTKNKAANITADDGTINMGSVNISGIEGGTIKVHTGNEAGNLEATNGGTINLGKVDVSNSNADIFINQDHLDSYNNKAQDVEATGPGSLVSVGSVSADNIQGGSLTVNTKNEATGKLTAKNGGQIYLGDVTEAHTNDATIKVTADNKLNEIIADDATVQVGSTDLRNINGGTVTVFTKNEVGGKIDASGRSSVSIGHTKMY